MPGAPTMEPMGIDSTRMCFAVLAPALNSGQEIVSESLTACDRNGRKISGKQMCLAHAADWVLLAIREWHCVHGSSEGTPYCRAMYDWLLHARNLVTLQSSNLFWNVRLVPRKDMSSNLHDLLHDRTAPRSIACLVDSGIITS